MKKIILFYLLVFFFCKTLVSQTYQAGETYFANNNYIEYKAGNLPIVISAPHGGTLEPTQIPDRNCSGCVYVRDLNTEDLVRKMYDAIFTEFGCYPHVIINRLHRRKLDANRAIGDAADGNALAEQAWNEFHDFIESSKDSVSNNFQKGIYLDLHGHGHDIQRLELGYLISKTKLQLTDIQLNDVVNTELSSILNLVNDNLNALSHADLLRDEKSFGELYEDENYPAVPSKTDPFPIGSEPYFSGGYNTARHGSRDDGTIDGIQIECNMDGVRDSNSNRTAFATATAKVLKAYLEEHYFGVGGLNSNCGTVASDKIDNNIFTIRVFPNPTQGVLNIELSESRSFSIMLVDELGKVYFQNEKVNTRNFQLRTTSFPKGIYFLKIKTDSITICEKILVL